MTAISGAATTVAGIVNEVIRTMNALIVTVSTAR